MSEYMEELELLAELCEKAGVSFSGVESGVIIEAMDKWNKRKLREYTTSQYAE